ECRARRGARARFQRRFTDREHALRLSAALHSQCQRHGAGAASAQHHHADRRCLRRPAAERAPDARAGQPPPPARAPLQGPRHRILLPADAFGVMPPIARLPPAQAIYHFLSGYPAKVAGTEKGVTEPEATFSTCFGAPFMPRHPWEYGQLLRKLIATHKVSCWLVNTGWTGGAYGVGRRMPIRETRALLAAALDGSRSEE